MMAAACGNIGNSQEACRGFEGAAREIFVAFWRRGGRGGVGHVVALVLFLLELPAGCVACCGSFCV